jgi:hypothetical protein
MTAPLDGAALAASPATLLAVCLKLLLLKTRHLL